MGAEEKKKKGTTTGMYSSSRMSDKESSKIDEIQNELNDTRVKFIEKEREVERLDAQLKLSSKGVSSSKMKRTGSQEDDLQKKMEVIEKEATILRERNTALEGENDRLTADNKQLHQKYGKKPPSSTNEKLQMVKFALEEKVRTLENKEKEHIKEIEKLQKSSSTLKQDTVE